MGFEQGAMGAKEPAELPRQPAQPESRGRSVGSATGSLWRAAGAPGPPPGQVRQPV